MQRSDATALLALALAGALVACNASSEGGAGNLRFTPRDCGRLGCDFADGIGVGGVLNVQIDRVGGGGTAGVELVSADPAALAVRPVVDVGGQPIWELEGLAAGRARLEAIGADDEVVDFLDVEVVPVVGLGLTLVLGEAEGPLIGDRHDERWTIGAGQAVSFQVTPLVAGGEPTMGRYLYQFAFDALLEQALIDRNTERGYLYFQVPAGEYAALVTDADDRSLRVLFVAE
jgi:hypothetical protein